MRIALGIEYNGQPFSGWQTQPHGNTVQDKINQALAKIAGVNIIRTAAAGRTDAGVHAALQVVHFDTEVQRPMHAWVRGVNAILPKEIAVLWAQPVSNNFHARFSACMRTYSYLLLTHPARPALMAGKVGWYHHPLDIRSMHIASTGLLGRHNFSSFRGAGCQAHTPMKHLMQLSIYTRKENIIQFDLVADGFLHQMVRNIVGALVHVGKGALSPEGLKELLHVEDRTAAPPPFVPDGLYLMGAYYPEHFCLPPTWADGTRILI